MAISHYNIDGQSFAMMECGECGIRHLIPRSFDDNNLKKGSSGPGWHCPNGHSRIYRESTADKLRRERDLLKQRIAQKDDRIASERTKREAAERAAAAQKGQVTKLKNRAKAGVCPCCNRTFQNLHRHMENKHPDFGKTEAA